MPAAPRRTPRPRRPDPVEPERGSAVSRALLAFGLLPVGLLGIHELAPLLVPITFGLSLALIVYPFVGYLEARGLRYGIALALALGTVLLIVAATLAFVAYGIAELVRIMPAYMPRFESFIDVIRGELADIGIRTETSDLPGLISPAAVAETLSGSAAALSGMTADFFILAFTLIYGVIGGRSLVERVRVGFGRGHALPAGVEHFGRDLRRYVLVRAQLGVFSAILNGLVAFGLDVPLAPLWALLTFAASFIPNIGGVIAFVPPVALALLDAGPETALLVFAGFQVVNFAQDYLVQPRLVGASLDLSPLATLLGVVVWVWVLGPAAALLAVPLTVGLIALLEADAATRPFGLLLRDRVPVMTAEDDEPA